MVMVKYNITKDPTEMHDIKNEEPEIYEELCQVWSEWNAEMGDRKWDDGGLWPQVTDTITIDLMKNFRNEELILYPGAKRKIQ